VLGKYYVGASLDCGRGGAGVPTRVAVAQHAVFQGLALGFGSVESKFCTCHSKVSNGDTLLSL
jgi:hypothetical protein